MKSTQLESNLVSLLQKDGSQVSANEVTDIVRGVIASPLLSPPDNWHQLICSDPSPQLKEALNELHSAIADNPGEGLPLNARAVALREEFARQDVDGFLVPRADEHQGEYVPLCSERLAWLTGFTGSAGVAVLFSQSGAVFVDGRYTLQVGQEVDVEVFDPVHLSDISLNSWLENNLKPGTRLGFDPWLHTVRQARDLRRICDKTGATLVACANNPLDAVWSDRPPSPISPALPHTLEYSGQASQEKRATIAALLKEKGATATVLTQPDSIAWLLNIRGSDVARTPLPLSFAILHADGRVDLCIDPRKLTEQTRAHLGPDVSIHRKSALGVHLKKLGETQQIVRLDPNTAADWIHQTLTGAGATLQEGADLCQLPKACKNTVELDGSRNAHIRDGAALTRFLAWIAAHGVGGQLTELDAVNQLFAFRAEDSTLRDLSFDTISGAGPNGAIVHYRVSEESNRAIEPGTLYLVDSGGQYPDGTTDVTRTVAIGEPTEEMKDRFTRVLKGHIALAKVRFAKGTTGSQLDALARMPLWEVGLDYDHGTGHGVGSYLGVHEGPQRISKVNSAVPLQPGMILSNEPGYYKTGAYGIRVENLQVVVPAQDPGFERDVLEFETLTMAPIDRSLVNPKLLSSDEVTWLNEYHRTVNEKLQPLLDPETARWLDAQTAPFTS